MVFEKRIKRSLRTPNYHTVVIMNESTVLFAASGRGLSIGQSAHGVLEGKLIKLHAISV